jgi:hypothetical protein
MEWLLKSVIPRLQWPKPVFKSKRAITAEEHAAIIARETNSERRDFYELLWHTGASQTDAAARFFFVDAGFYVKLSYGIQGTGVGRLTYDVRTRSQFRGRAGITQVATLDYDTVGMNVTDFLDAKQFYSEMDILENAHRFLNPPHYIETVNDFNLHDLPSVSKVFYIPKRRLKGEFKDYVRFRPNGPDNIYATVGLVTWNMHGEIEAALNWNFTHDEHPAPSDVDQSVDDFPVWYGTITTNTGD